PEFPLNKHPEFLAELGHHERVAGGVIRERTWPAVAQGQDPLGGDVACGFDLVFSYPPDQSGKVDCASCPGDFALTLPPESRHPLTKIGVEEPGQLSGPVDPISGHLLLDVTQVENQLQELERDALSRRLRTDEHRQIAEANVGFTDLADVLELQTHGAHLRLRGSWAVARQEKGEHATFQILAHQKA